MLSLPDTGLVCAGRKQRLGGKEMQGTKGNECTDGVGWPQTDSAPAWRRGDVSQLSEFPGTTHLMAWQRVPAQAGCYVHAAWCSLDIGWLLPARRSPTLCPLHHAPCVALAWRSALISTPPCLHPHQGCLPPCPWPTLTILWCCFI